VPVIGTLSVLLAAKRSGRLDAIRPVVEELLAYRMYLSDGIVRRVSALAGE
jgi:predicted nucleic acid-binding protein